MGWSIVSSTGSLNAGDRVRIEVQFRNPPFMSPNANAIREVMDYTPITSDSVSESLLTSVTPGLNSWTVIGTVDQAVGVNELRQEIVDKLSSLWNAFDVYVNSVEIESFSFPQPSTQTAISLAAIAVLAVLGFYLLWRLKIV